MNQMDLKIKALRIYLDEIQQMHQELECQNEELVAFLIENGHKNIEEKLKLFKIKYITGKIN